MSLKISANVGFLWDQLELPDRILAAKQAGFDAVECHFPYDYPATELRSVLEATELPMVGINTLLGESGSSDFGTAAIAGKEEQARGYIDQAIEYAHTIGAGNINVVAGLTSGSAEGESVFRENLRYACQQAAAFGKTILIEPLNPRAVAGYHFSTVEQAIATIDAVAENNIKLMFDCFHTQIVQGDLITLLQEHIGHIGHVQISAVHDRGEPDQGEIYYPYVLGMLEQLGYTGYIGAEYKPRGTSVESGLSWLEQYRRS